MKDGELREKTRRSIARLVAGRRGADNWDDDDYMTAGNILFVCSRLIKQYGIQERIDVLRSLPQDTICASGLLINSPTIVSEWVAGSVVNNEIRRLTALKDKEQS